MAARSQPLLEDALSSYGEIEEGVVSYSEGKTAPAFDYGEGCTQRLLERKASYYFSVRLLSVTLVSLAVVYFILQCFDLTRGYRVAPLRRSLAVGGGRKCNIYGEKEEYEQGGKGAENEDFWVGEFESRTSESPTKADAPGPSAGQTERKRGRASIPTIANGAGSGITHGLGSGREPITNAASARASTQLLEPGSHSPRGTSPVRHPQPPGAPLPGPEGLGGDDGNERMNASSKLPPGETDEMWGGRNIPPHTEEKLESLFSRMQDAVSVCKSLLPALSESHRLRLSYEVVRLMALEVGAISLVPERLERLRSNLSNAIANMGTEALSLSNARWGAGESADMRKLIVMVHQLKKRRPVKEKDDPSRYRAKMISILQTSTRVVDFCAGVLKGLLEFKDGPAIALPPSNVDQQIDVVAALYKVLSAQVAADVALRFHIVACQKRTGIFLLLGREHLELSSTRLRPVSEVLEEIISAVARAGGLLKAPERLQTKHDTPLAIGSRAPQHMENPNKPFPGAAGHTQHRESAIPVVGPYFILAGIPLFQSLQEAPSSPSQLHPRFQPLPLGYHAPQHHPGQPLPSLLPLLGSSPLVGRVPHEEPSTSGIYTQATATTTGVKEPMPPKPHLLSERGGVSPAPHPSFHVRRESTPFPLPYSQPTSFHMSRDSTPFHHPYTPPTSFHVSRETTPFPHPYTQPSSFHVSRESAPVPHPYTQPPTARPAFGGASADVEGLIHPPARPTEQAWGGPFSSDYGVIQGAASQNQETEEEEEVGGLLAELLKGGVDYEAVFGRKKPRKQ
ncbi:hypothetical protein, conserved [Eimeria brunetti]|uniref:Transmembrane protein n=1 Tax=Eimeria brunetti TaxID=51314 RepID=U6LAG2_9EIME|nr:hypothetical protein, conserved [Eimeria brunetti]